MTVVDQSYEGILGVMFKNKQSGFELVVFTCYLPPENSPWGRDASRFYTHLLTQIYLLYDIYAIVICGDLNSRIGNVQDINNTVDNIPCRLVKDQTQNQHGNSFIEFLNDTRICILNGRYGDDSNNYTFQSSRGQSVVDF